MPTITIRAPRPADAEAIARLSAELGYPATPGAMAARLAILLTDPTQCVRVAEAVDGRVVGWAHAAHQVVLESGDRCELLGLVTASAARGTGIGRLLVETIERWARDRRLPLVSLRCNVTRAAARGFYEHLGYQQVKTQHAFRKSLGGAADARPVA